MNSTKRVIQAGRAREALEIIRDSDRVAKEHPEARQMAIDLLSRL